MVLVKRVYLPFDISRCNGEKLGEPCPDRDRCSRYLARGSVGDRTPFLLPNKFPCEFFDAAVGKTGA